MSTKLFISFLALACVLVGCSSGPQPLAQDEMKDAAQQNAMVRGIFDANGGDYDKVSAADKQKLVTRFKTDASARDAFEKIKHPPGGMGGGGAPIPNAPQGQ